MTEINVEELLIDYKLDYGKFTALDDRLYKIRKKIEQLSLPEKIILVLYAELQSFRKVADYLGVSHTSINNYFKEIRKKLLTN